MPSWRYVDSRLGDSADPSFQLPSYQLLGVFMNTHLSATSSLASIWTTYWMSTISPAVTRRFGRYPMSHIALE